MKRLWAPWRIKYILQDKPTACFLCKAVEKEKDNETFFLTRGKTCGVILNRYPYNNGHLMVFPYRHTGMLEDLTDQEQLEMMSLTSTCTKMLTKVMSAEGFNIGINIGKVAGAGLEDHIHMHIVPRWNGDTNFMPTLGDTRVLPQSLEETWQLLRNYLTTEK